MTRLKSQKPPLVAVAEEETAENLDSEQQQHALVLPSFWVSSDPVLSIYRMVCVSYSPCPQKSNVQKP
uniref:Uncharacterized protein n=1 Tax=Lotus japonicus TaxID=34305 RepID=I3SFX6_LOTJA|nr:unknown [Lotus japonicus]